MVKHYCGAMSKATRILGTRTIRPIASGSIPVQHNTIDWSYQSRGCVARNQTKARKSHTRSLRYAGLSPPYANLFPTSKKVSRPCIGKGSRRSIRSFRNCFSTCLTVGGMKIFPLSSRNPGNVRSILLDEASAFWGASNIGILEDQLTLLVMLQDLPFRGRLRNSRPSALPIFRLFCNLLRFSCFCLARKLTRQRPGHKHIECSLPAAGHPSIESSELQTTFLQYPTQ